MFERESTPHSRASALAQYILRRRAHGASTEEILACLTEGELRLLREHAPEALATTQSERPPLGYCMGEPFYVN